MPFDEERTFPRVSTKIADLTTDQRVALGCIRKLRVTYKVQLDASGVQPDAQSRDADNKMTLQLR